MEFGVLSTAHIGTDYVIPAVRASEHAVGAIGSRDADRARAVAAEHGVERAYGSYEAVLADDGIDAVYVPLPNGLHAEWTRRAADEGLDVLCEKPLGADADEAAATFDHCEARGVTLMEGFMYRFHPRTERALEVARDVLGEVRYVEGTFTFQLGDREDDIRLDPDLAGGSLRDVGCYPVDAARLFLGEPDRAFAHAADAYDSGVDSQLAGTLLYGDGAAAHVTGGFDAAHVEYYRVQTADGWLEARDAFGPDADRAVSLTWSLDGEAHTETFDPVDHYRREIEGFAAAAESGRPPRVDRADTLGTARATDALRESDRRGEAVEVA